MLEFLQTQSNTRREPPSDAAEIDFAELNREESTHEEKQQTRSMNEMTKTLGQKDVKILRHIVGVTSGCRPLLAGSNRVADPSHRLSEMGRLAGHEWGGY
ncbi:hypothetical protein QJS10_CPB04g01231 [Acorus calamus]|uniref:Uncharacterized protein n=1 Tax=Acorus calamus TaxID=4465 RepID=A0AAV9EWX0_ACOCL|nr:hypothetical protein QJS10_CPB04g01231 [Acorus calamus]